MNKHFTFQDRVKLQYNLDNNYNLSASLLAKILKKSRNAIYYELKVNTTVTKRAEIFNNSTSVICVRLTKFPFTCNGCPNVRCSHRTRFYDAYLANEKARHTLKASRSDTSLKRENIRIINNDVCALINKGQSVYVAKSTSGCPLSESTIRRYINNDLVESKRSDLPKSLRFKGKKEYNYPKSHNIDINVLNGRTYQDYKEFIDKNKELKVIQLDSIIGLRTDDKAILTIYFVNSKLQLGIFYSRKHSNVVEILKKLYRLSQSHGETLFDVALADNGSEFRNLYKLEIDDSTGEYICRTFYCDPYRSCQKAECERNHGIFRRFIPKGRTFKLVNQEELDDVFSHINNYPRSSLKGKTPFELFAAEYNPIILSELNIHQIKRSDVSIKQR